jgi:hypothetical protein
MRSTQNSTRQEIPAFILFSIQKRSKLGKLLQIDANEIEIRKKQHFPTFLLVIVPSFDSAHAENRAEYWCATASSCNEVNHY